MVDCKYRLGLITQALGIGVDRRDRETFGGKYLGSQSIWEGDSVNIYGH